MIILLAVLGIFLTWFSSKRRDVLLTLCTALLWLGLAMWLFFSTTPVLGLSENYEQILAWVFFILIFVPIIIYMNTESRHEASTKGGERISWAEWGADVQDRLREKPDGYENYKKALRRRLRR